MAAEQDHLAAPRPPVGPAGDGGRPVRVAPFAELEPGTLYELLRLRVDVFVVEQNAPYPELDGRDTEPGTRHLWIDERPGAPVAYLRILEDPGGTARIGRVVVAPHARGDGHATRLMRAALALIGDRACVLSAQAHLSEYYGRFGFQPAGPEFLEDGIPHIPMRRDKPVTTTAPAPGPVPS